MATKTWVSNKSARVARRTSDNWDAGSGASDFLPVGLYSGYKYRTLIDFPEDWSGVVKITSAKLRLRTSTQFYVGFGSDPDIYVDRIDTSWSEGTSVSLSSSNAVVYPGPGVSTAERVSKDVSTSEQTWIEIDITDLIEAIAPTSVKKRDGTPGGDATFHGVRLIAVDEGTATDVTEFYSDDTSSQPEIVITYSTNTLPGAPTLNSPVGGAIVADTTPSLVFTHSDAQGDACSGWDLQVSTDPTFASVTHWDQPQQTTGISGNTVTVTYAGTALARGTTYYWRARTYDPTGWGSTPKDPGTWSSAGSFAVNRLPTATKVSPAASGLAHIHNLATDASEWTAAGTNAQPRFTWSYSDADGDAQASYRVRIYSASVGGTLLHDSGTLAGTATTYDAAYGVKNGDQASSEYWWTIEVTDARGESSGESSRTAFRVLWGQAIYEYAVTGGTNSSSWAFSSGSIAANTQKAFLYRNATGASGAGAGAWQTSIGSVAPAAYLNVLVRLATSAAGTNPAMPDMTFSYVGSAVFPDKWNTQADSGGATGADWTLDADRRRFGTRSLRCAVSTAIGNRWITPEALVTVAPSTDYTLSCFVRTAAPLASGATIRLRIYNDAITAEQAALYTDTAEYETSDTAGYPEGWQRLVLRFTTASGQTTLRPLIHYLHNGSTSGDVFWVDAVKIEEGNVATAWAPGTIGSSIIDSGGIAIDGSRGGIFRLRGSDGGARDMVELGANGLIFGGDTEVYSPATGGLIIRSDDSGDFLQVGNDAQLVDVDIADTIGIYGVQNPANGIIVLGSGKDTNLYRGGANLLRTDDWFAHGGILRAGGTSFPGGISTGDRCFRTDLGMEFFYDGTRWLSTAVYEMAMPADIANISATAADTCRTGRPEARGGSDVVIVGFGAGYHVTSGTALSASHKWTVQLKAGSGGVVIATKTIDSGASASWRHDSPVAADYAVGGATYLFLTATKTGTPGNLYFYGTYTYRVVAT